MGLRGKAAPLLATAAFFGSIGMIGQANAQAVSDRILSDVSAQTVGSCSTMTVRFNIRVQVLSYFPQSSGRELHIRVKPLEGQAPLSRESLRTPEGIRSLRSIEYEGDNAQGPILSLYFNRDVQFEAAAGERPQDILITVSEPGGGCDTQQLSSIPKSGETPAPAPTTNQPAIPIPSGLYVVNVLAQPKEVSGLGPAQADALADLMVYETRFERDGQTWHRLRAGFFESRDAAEAARAGLLKVFPDAWVVKVTSGEREQGVATRIAVGGNATPSATLVPPTAPLSEADRVAAAKAEADAEAALTAGENDRAIQLLTKALAYPENDRTPRALELLGLTRERKGQAAHAKAEYEEYLRRYPQGEGSDRVRQRLSALTSGGQTAPELRLPTNKDDATQTADTWRWGKRGSFSQFYFRDQSSSKFLDATVVDPNAEVDNSVNLNQLLSSADVTVTGGNGRSQLLIRSAGSYTNNFRQGGRDIKTLSALYVDYQDNTLNLSTRIGRQTRNNSGVLGRFDGALVGWQFQPKVKLNVVAGFPVSSSRVTKIKTDRFFYGVSADIGSNSDKVQTTLYWFDQRSHGMIDRQAVGAEVRYINNQFNAYSVVDYDVHFSKMNLALITMNYTMKDQSSLSLTADYRQSPLLTTNNALNGLGGQTLPGQLLPIRTLADLKDSFTDKQIYGLAQGNTIVTKSLTASYSRPINQKLQANFDFTMTNTGGAPGSTVVVPGSTFLPPIPKVGTEYYYGTQLIGSGMIFANDIYILSARYADNQNSRTYTGDINARIPVTKKFRVSPRLRYAYREFKLTQNTSRQFQPTLRMNYYPMRQSEVEIEIGGNFSKQRNYLGSTLDSTFSERGVLLSIGYRIDF